MLTWDFFHGLDLSLKLETKSQIKHEMKIQANSSQKHSASTGRGFLLVNKGSNKVNLANNFFTIIAPRCIILTWILLFLEFFLKNDSFQFKTKTSIYDKSLNFLQNNNTFPYALKIVLRFWHFERSKVGLKTITKQSTNRFQNNLVSSWW